MCSLCKEGATIHSIYSLYIRTACVLRLLLAVDNNTSNICNVISLICPISPFELLPGTSSRYWYICE